MSATRFLVLGLALVSGVMAQSSFPGLQTLLNEAEWKRAGLTRLTPDEIGVIDAALIRYFRQVQATSVPASSPPAASVANPAVTPAEQAAARARQWESFGFGKVTGDWRAQPAMPAKVTGWVAANRFSLDTGQVWEGMEPIPFELPGRDVVIEVRPMGAFALKVDEGAFTVRVRRVR